MKQDKYNESTEPSFIRRMGFYTMESNKRYRGKSDKRYWYSWKQHRTKQGYRLSKLQEGEKVYIAWSGTDHMMGYAPSDVLGIVLRGDVLTHEGSPCKGNPRHTATCLVVKIIDSHFGAYGAYYDEHIYHYPPNAILKPVAHYYLKKLIG